MSLNPNPVSNESPMQCLVIDDEPLAREGIIDFIAKLDFLQVAGTCSTAMEASEYIQKGNIDLLFLDINMPYLSGLEFLESLEHPPLTILTTAYSEHAMEGYRLQIVDYLLKPITFKRFYQAALKARQFYLMSLTPKNPRPIDTFLYVRQGDCFLKISWVDILYIEGMQNYAKLHFKDRELVIHQTMISLEETLPGDNFFRIHKSFLINIAHIDSVSGGRVFINGQELPISRTRREDLLKEVVYTKLLSR
ncbi:LytR/AlgR family response regulator transcription factor [Pedobacter nutrimenti]|uniref:LytTR family two component transcriptional regulator n=1 Tax=Pedobacter nutrimenti TaxID=1241337 RepID=A0A318UHA0_9SPHI|nr:LytTR family DNA-binding domain-containing protein [Pedobacter nutrimenti]PYF74697.1 LytTR family two component transcriptional regulator [Pedobacter nutrimenti]